MAVQFRIFKLMLNLLVVAFLSTAGASEPIHAEVGVPVWAKSAVWYQVFLERFRNGDSGNDPRLEDLQGAWPHLAMEDWEPTEWGHDWYELEDWARPKDEFYKTVYMRRYGGDLQGLIDKLDYLNDLGVTAIYLNPINDAPSLHKYDARNYRHVDRNFGPNPVGDSRMMEAEQPSDPSTWRWTSADRLFLTLIDRIHQLGMKVIVDYSWNHTGTTFWAWQDVIRNQANSNYRDWYEIESFDDPKTPSNEFAYRGWHGVADLPQLNRGPRNDGEVDLHPDVKKHVYAVTKRWLDPNGDGNPADGIDGFRLDVAAELPMAFWRDYRRFVKRINPQAILLGEIWWEQWPIRLADPSPWLTGDTFDSVMDYRGYVASRGLFADALPKESPSSYARVVKQHRTGMSMAASQSLMCLVSGHDSPRSLTSVHNPGLYKYRTNPRADPQYSIERPDAPTRRKHRMILLRQFTTIGAPHIYYGDEVGMWGADDPDNRKPMVWGDIAHANEKSDPFSRPRSSDSVKVDADLLAYYRQLIRLRLDYSDLFVDGGEEFVDVDDDEDWLVVARNNDRRRAIVVFNLGKRQRTYCLHREQRGLDPLTQTDFELKPGDDGLQIPVPAVSGRVVILDST